MSGQWYYQVLMEEFGPVSADELIDLYNAGTLGDDDTVRHGSGDWITLADAMTELESSTDSADDSADEINDLSELAFEFEDSGPTKARVSPAASRTDESAVKQPMPTRSIASSERSELTAEQQNSADKSATATNADWYYMSFGHMMGPMSFDALQDLARTGVITAEDPVRCGTEGGWRRARNLPGLAIHMAIAQASNVPPGEAIGSGRGSEVASNAAAKKLSDSDVSAANDSPETSEEVQSKGEAKGKSPRRKADKKRVRTQDELPDDVFDDIFSSPSVPLPPMQKTVSTGVAPASAVPPAGAGSNAASASSVPVEKPTSESTPSRTTSSSISQPFSTSSPAAAPRPMAVPAPMKQKSGGQGFSIDPKILGVIGGVIGVVVLAGALWQFGLPFGGSGTAFKPTYVKENLNKVLLQLDVAITSKKEASWTRATTEANVAVGMILAHAKSCGEDSASVTAAISAVGTVQKILAMKMGDNAEIDKAKAEVQALILKIN